MHLKKNGHQISINSLNSHKPMTWLNKQVQKRPDHPAFYFQDESWTFLEVQQEAVSYTHLTLPTTPYV